MFSIIAHSNNMGLQQWLVDGGLVLIASTIFYSGRNLGRINSELMTNRELGIQNRDDIRDLRAQLYGVAPRPRIRHSRETDSILYPEEE